MSFTAVRLTQQLFKLCVLLLACCSPQLGTVRPEDVPDELVTAVAGALQASQLMEVHSTGFQVRARSLVGWCMQSSCSAH
jgi:hypothetical protein